MLHDLCIYLSCKCGSTDRRLETCQDLANYETSNVVKYEGIEIAIKASEVYPKLSGFKDDYIEEIKKELISYFPQHGDPSKGRLQTIMFHPLDHQSWPEKETGMKNYVARNIEEVAKLFKIPYNQQLQTEFELLVKNILMDSLPPEDEQNETPLGQAKS